MSRIAEILPTHTPALFRAAVVRAAELLRRGEVVALPTETVYGLAANALDPQAVARIYAAKGRPVHNPVIVHVANLEMARDCASHWPGLADRLAAAFWPGPLTLVVQRAPGIPDVVTAGGATVGIRWPGHPFIQEVIRECGFPLAAPSANAANELSPTNAAHVVKSLGERIPLVVDGGQCQVGLESTVVDVTGAGPRILRPGMIHEEAIKAATGNTAAPATEAHASEQEGFAPLRSPGQLRKHYAPKARLVVDTWRNDDELRAHLARFSVGAGRAPRTFVIAHSHIPSGEQFAGVSVIPHDAEAFARALYAELHRCDEAGAELIVVEAPPAGGEWQAIHDRLQRAAAR